MPGKNKVEISVVEAGLPLIISTRDMFNVPYNLEPEDLKAAGLSEGPEVTYEVALAQATKACGELCKPAPGEEVLANLMVFGCDQNWPDESIMRVQLASTINLASDEKAKPVTSEDISKFSMMVFCAVARMFCEKAKLSHGVHQGDLLRLSRQKQLEDGQRARARMAQTPEQQAAAIDAGLKQQMEIARKNGDVKTVKTRTARKPAKAKTPAKRKTSTKRKTAKK